jgi:predicted transposase YdaD
MSTLSNPHDHFFKAVFSRPEVAGDFLRRYLPADVADVMDLNSLVISKDTFIDNDLREHYC